MTRAHKRIFQEAVRVGRYECWKRTMVGQVADWGSLDEAREETGMLASDADREHMVERLRAAALEGRLTAEELEDRIAAVLRTRRVPALERLVRDVPLPKVPVTPEAKKHDDFLPFFALCILITILILLTVATVFSPEHPKPSAPARSVSNELRNLERIPVNRAKVHCVIFYDANGGIAQEVPTRWAVITPGGMSNATNVYYQPERGRSSTVIVDAESVLGSSAPCAVGR